VVWDAVRVENTDWVLFMTGINFFMKLIYQQGLNSPFWFV
jgi:hypothetical protein